MQLEDIIWALAEINFKKIETEREDDELRLYIHGSEQYEGDAIHLTIYKNSDNYDLAMFIDKEEDFFHNTEPHEILLKILDL